MKKHNFNPGPSILPQFTVEKTAEAVLDLNGTGLSVMSISHRSKEFTAIIQSAKSLIKELLDIPDGYSILFLGGGASLQFSTVPYNLLNRKAAYLNTGSWASKAIPLSMRYPDKWTCRQHPRGRRYPIGSPAKRIRSWRRTTGLPWRTAGSRIRNGSTYPPTTPHW